MSDPAVPFTDKTQLREDLYANAGKLSARSDLHERFGTNPQPFADWELGLVDLSGVRRALDAGCGSGNFLLPLARRLVRAGAEVIGLDLSDGMLTTARERLAAEGLSVACQVGDVEALPFADSTFDLILANYMLYHLPHLDQGIAELRRVLKPGGVLLAATNSERNMPELLDLGLRACQEAGVPEATLRAVVQGGRLAAPVNFTLESGAEALGRSFADVRVERYPGELRVTDADALTAYFASMWVVDMVVNAAEQAPDARVALRALLVERFRAAVAADIARDGMVRISKDTGAFAAR
jgi:SAM-dependent methyltransferase